MTKCLRKSGSRASKGSKSVRQISPKKIGANFVHETVLPNCWTNILADFQWFLTKNPQLFYLTSKTWSDYLLSFLLRALACRALGKIVFGRVRTNRGHGNKSPRFLHVFVPYKHTFLHFGSAVLLWKIEKIKKGDAASYIIALFMTLECQMGNVSFFEVKQLTQGQTLGWPKTDSIKFKGM